MRRGGIQLGKAALIPEVEGALAERCKSHAVERRDYSCPLLRNRLNGPGAEECST
jgi:hypothetical protein